MVSLDFVAEIALEVSPEMAEEVEVAVGVHWKLQQVCTRFGITCGTIW